jgi:hypothetical protein
VPLRIRFDLSHKVFLEALRVRPTFARSIAPPDLSRTSTSAEFRLNFRQQAKPVSESLSLRAFHERARRLLISWSRVRIPDGPSVLSYPKPYNRILLTLLSFCPTARNAQKVRAETKFRLNFSADPQKCSSMQNWRKPVLLPELDAPCPKKGIDLGFHRGLLALCKFPQHRHP